MNISDYVTCFISIALALIIMFRLMHYAHFYATSYFLWTGAIISITGLIAFIIPLDFLLIRGQSVSIYVTTGGLLLSGISILFPVKQYQSRKTPHAIDELMPEYSFNEFHDVEIEASAKEVQKVLRVTGVRDIPAALLLMKLRGIAREDVDMSSSASKTEIDSDRFSTPDFNFIIASPDEYITLMILKAAMLTDKSRHPAPPVIESIEQFKSFNSPGYVKVVMNFRFISSEPNRTRLTTETRIHGITAKDSRVFSRYWRLVYPGSAIIRRVWLDTIKRKAES